jgi:hypothetical protein
MRILILVSWHSQADGDVVMGDPSHSSNEDDGDPNGGGDSLFHMFKKILEQTQPKTYSDTVNAGKGSKYFPDEESSGSRGCNSSSGWGSDENFEEIVGDRVWPAAFLRSCVLLFWNHSPPSLCFSRPSRDEWQPRTSWGATYVLWSLFL